MSLFNWVSDGMVNENDQNAFSIPQIHALGYSGGPLLWANQKFVIDLSSLRFRSEKIVCLKQHQNESDPIGHWDSFMNNGRELHLYGALSGPMNRGEDPAVRVASAQKHGFRWPASIGLEAADQQKLNPKKTYTINGRDFTGLNFALINAILMECSAVNSGRDPLAYFEIIFPDENGLCDNQKISRNSEDIQSLP